MEFGLIINEKETKHLKCTKKNIRTKDLNINSITGIESFSPLVGVREELYIR